MCEIYMEKKSENLDLIEHILH